MAIMKLSNKIRPESCRITCWPWPTGLSAGMRRRTTSRSLSCRTAAHCPKTSRIAGRICLGSTIILPIRAYALIRLYPWVGESLLCPWCADEIRSDGILAHPSDAHVRTGEISPDEQAEWIEEMEPEPEKEEDGAEDERRHYRRAVDFRDEDQCAEVLKASRYHGLTVNAFWPPLRGFRCAIRISRWPNSPIQIRVCQ